MVDFFMHGTFLLEIIHLLYLCMCSVAAPVKPLDFKEPPLFLPTTTNVTVHQGELAVLRCHIVNLWNRTVVWIKTTEDFPLTINNLVFGQGNPEDKLRVQFEYMSKRETRVNLLIDNVQPRHAGLYECQVSAIDLYTHYVELVVLEPLPQKPALAISGTQFITQGETLRLVCNASGSSRAPDDVDWFYKGNRIHTANPTWHDRTRILKHIPIPGRTMISELIIEKTTMKDQGIYLCRSSDLKINSMTVHVLNTDKNITRRGTEIGNKAGSNKSSGSSIQYGTTVVTLCFIVFSVT